MADSTSTPRKSARSEATPLIRSMRVQLAWSAEAWKAFTVADFRSRLESLIAEATATLATASDWTDSTPRKASGKVDPGKLTTDQLRSLLASAETAESFAASAVTYSAS